MPEVSVPTTTAADLIEYDLEKIAKLTEKQVQLQLLYFRHREYPMGAVYDTAGKVQVVAEAYLKDLAANLAQIGLGEKAAAVLGLI